MPPLPADEVLIWWARHDRHTRLPRADPRGHAIRSGWGDAPAPRRPGAPRSAAEAGWSRHPGTVPRAVRRPCAAGRGRRGVRAGVCYPGAECR